MRHSSAVLLESRTGRTVVDRDLRRSLEERGIGDVAEQLERARLRPAIRAMAERNPPLFMDVSNAYSGDELGLPNRDFIGEGIVGATDLLVSAGAANSVNVAAGAAWVLGDTNPALQPNYRVYNDASVNLGISPDPTNPRRVLVGAQITDQGFAGTGRLWALSAIHGTPAGSPALPATPASFLPLADVLVPAAAASSAAYTFTDLRSRASIGGGQAQLSTGGAALSWTPLLTGSVTNPALGNGTSVGKYVQIGKMVYAEGKITFGSTSTFGSGIWFINLPPPTPDATDPQLGKCFYGDTSLGQTWVGHWQGFLYTNANPLVGVGPAAPFAWATTDTLQFSITYIST